MGGMDHGDGDAQHRVSLIRAAAREEDWQRLTTQITPSQIIDSLDPQRYSAHFPGIAVDELLLEDWDGHGQTDRHGPFEVGHAYGFDAVAHAQRIGWTAIRAENASDKAQRTVMAKALASPDAPSYGSPNRASNGSASTPYARPAPTSAGPPSLTRADRRRSGYPEHIIDANDNSSTAATVSNLSAEITATLYSAHNAYRLRIDPARVKAANSRALDPKNAVPGLFVDTVKFERQKACSTPPHRRPWYDQPAIRLWQTRQSLPVLPHDLPATGATPPSTCASGASPTGRVQAMIITSSSRSTASKSVPSGSTATPTPAAPSRSLKVYCKRPAAPWS
ncbi:MAG: hypothetical protein R3F44_00345 [Candidatus Competibacteraceae bacterium]